MKLEIGIPYRNLLRNRARTMVAVFTVSGGVLAFLLAGGFIAWIFQDMREATVKSQLGHVQIVRPQYFDKGIADPYSFLLPAESAEEGAVRAIRGVVSVTPRLAFSGLLSIGDATVPFIGEGVDPIRERPISARMTIVAGHDLESEAQRAVLLGEGLAKSVGAKPGDTVVLLGTSSNGGPAAVELKVAGVFATVTKSYDDTALRIPIAVARRLMRVEGATSWVVLLDQTEHTDLAVQQLGEILPAKSFQLVPWVDLADFYNKTVTLFSSQVQVMKFIIGLIIVLTITNTLMMNVLERTMEVGTSLAIGMHRSTILRLFVVEGVMIGALGGLLGVVLGYFLAMAISAIGIPMPPPPGMMRGYVGQILLTPKLALDAVVLSLITTLLASLVPAWKASRMVIVDALRCNQ